MNEFSLSIEQQSVIADIDEGKNVLVTGSAGTGKSTLLKAIRSKFDMPVTASTGIAAVNVGGLTIHSWAGLGLAKQSAQEIARNLRVDAYYKIKETRRLAIDEISMISAEFFTKIDQLFRIVRGTQLPFGGMQLVLFGDFLQLPPVIKDTPNELLQREVFAFESQSWRETNIKTHLLTKVFRQADARFSSVLNSIRVGDVTADVSELLNSRFNAIDENPKLEPVVVHTHNVDVDTINSIRLEKIDGEERTFEAMDSGQPGPMAMLDKHCLAPKTLMLKIGAQVMLLCNIDPAAGLANGSVGTVTGFSENDMGPLVSVFFNNGEMLKIGHNKWEIIDGSKVVATRKQIPLRLAWAITSHKSQGMTLDKVQVFLAKCFEYGQAYVALSRARTAEGLFVASGSRKSIKAHPAAVDFYRNIA